MTDFVRQSNTLKGGVRQAGEVGSKAVVKLHISPIFLKSLLQRLPIILATKYFISNVVYYPLVAMGPLY